MEILAFVYICMYSTNMQGMSCDHITTLSFRSMQECRDFKNNNSIRYEPLPKKLTKLKYKYIIDEKSKGYNEIRNVCVYVKRIDE